MKPYYALIAIVLLTASCSQDVPELTPTQPPTLALPTLTSTLVSTDTPKPTVTPRPTMTPVPPTATLPPTPVPEIITLNGSGDSVVDTGLIGNPIVAHIIGNAGGRHFAIESFDSDGERIDLLVNTTDPFDGFIPIDWVDDQTTNRLQISSTGEWTIELIPFAPIPEIREHFLFLPGEYESNGHDVIFLMEGVPDLASITGNTDERFFAVFEWGGSGKNLLVNTTDAYEGTVMLSSDTFALQVIAEGSWIVSVTAK